MSKVKVKATIEIELEQECPNKWNLKDFFAVIDKRIKIALASRQIEATKIDVTSPAKE